MHNIGTILSVNVKVTQTAVTCYDSRFFSFGIGGSKWPDLLRKGAGGSWYVKTGSQIEKH